MSSTKDYDKIMHDLLAEAKDDDLSELSEATLRVACSILFVGILECGPENRTKAIEFLVGNFRERLDKIAMWERTMFHAEGNA